jgi:TRAP transporter TAXI family solute receptor
MLRGKAAFGVAPMLKKACRTKNLRQLVSGRTMARHRRQKKRPTDPTERMRPMTNLPTAGTLRRISAALALAALLPGAAAAQVVTLGSTTAGATGQMGRAIAATVSELSPLNMRPQEMANTADYMPLVNAGEIDFGISNVVQLWFASQGTGMSQGQPGPDLRAVAVLQPFRAGLQVRNDGDIATIEDVAGKRVPQFPDASLGDHVMRAFLANAGLTYDDVVGVPVPNFPRMWDSFREGSTDAVIDVPGSANSRELDAAVGGIRYLSFNDSPETLEAMREWLPQTFLMEIGPDSGLPGFFEPTMINAYAYTFFANAGVPEDRVYEVTKAMHEGEQALLATGPIWAGLDRSRYAVDIDVPFHPGAIRFYREAGIWPE